MGQTADKSVGIGQLRCRPHFLIRSFQFTVTDILRHCSGKQVGILQHNAQRMPQIRFFDLVDVDAVITDLPVGHIVESVDQIGNRSLSGSGGADEGNLLPRRRVHPDVVEHDLVVGVAEVHAVEDHVSLQLHISGGAVRLVEMLPRPHAGALLRLHNLAVLLLRVYQRDIAVVNFRLLIQQREHAVCSGHGHHDEVQLHADLVDGHGKTPVE